MPDLPASAGALHARALHGLSMMLQDCNVLSAMAQLKAGGMPHTGSTHREGGQC
jgi:hypothetical protein